MLGAHKREIIDRLTATVGTEVNWRMMEKVIAEVDKLDMVVDHHDAGDYDLGRSYALLHTLNKSNCTKNFMVIIIIFVALCHKIGRASCRERVCQYV